jgi:hypothetical protein
MDEGRERWLDQATRALVVAMALAVLLNGLPFWGRRVGLLERQAYRRELALFCQPPLRSWWLPATCRPHRLVMLGPTRTVERIDVLRLYKIRGPEVGLKAGRYGVLLAVVIGSVALLLARWQAVPPPQAWLPLLPLLLSTLLSAGISLGQEGGAASWLPLLWSLWIPLAAWSGWLTTPNRLQCLADGAAALVVLQLPFLALEAMRGLPMPFGAPANPWLPTRLSGLMTHPNTLGGLLAISVALCVAVSGRRWQRWPLLLLSLGMAILARSGTGVVALAVLAAGMGVGHLPRRWRLFPVILSLVALTAALPQLLGRPQLFDSPSGRVSTLRMWLAIPRSAQERWLGYGLASTGDLKRTAPIPGVSHASAGPPPKGAKPSADGQPLLLLTQGGVVALVAFYGLIGWVAWHDVRQRLFWTVVALTSLTLNLTEVFPLIVWLAVMMARGLGSPALKPATPRD